MTINNTVSKKFLSKAMLHGDAMDRGDYKKANKFHKDLQRIYELAKGQNNLAIFKEHLTHYDESVRLWAAIFSLTTTPDLALKSLGDLKKSARIIATTAETTIQLWKDGKLDLL